MEQTRNWQEDWEHVETMIHAKTLVNRFPIQTMHGPMQDGTEVLAYWLQEVKRLRESLAHANCEWQNEKTMRINLAAEANKEKRRADTLETENKQLKQEIKLMKDGQVDLYDILEG